jgi:hypothetical protein
MILSDYFRPYVIRTLSYLDCFRLSRQAVTELFHYGQFPRIQVRAALMPDPSPAVGKRHVCVGCAPAEARTAVVPASRSHNKADFVQPSRAVRSAAPPCACRVRRPLRGMYCMWHHGVTRKCHRALVVFDVQRLPTSSRERPRHRCAPLSRERQLRAINERGREAAQHAGECVAARDVVAS